MLHCYIRDSFKFYDPAELAAGPKDLLIKNGNTIEFNHRHGNRFVSGHHRGDELYAIISIFTEDKKEQIEIANTIHGQVLSWNPFVSGGGGTIDNHELRKKASSLLQIDINIYQSPGMGSGQVNENVQIGNNFET